MDTRIHQATQFHLDLEDTYTLTGVPQCNDIRHDFLTAAPTIWPCDSLDAPEFLPKGSSSAGWLFDSAIIPRGGWKYILCWFC